MNELMYDIDLFDLDGNLLPKPTLVMDSIRNWQLWQTEFAKSGFGPFSLPPDLEGRITTLKSTLFKGLMSYARVFDIEFISVGSQDLISPDIKGRSRYDAGFMWDVKRAMNLDLSCGNGIGKLCRQSQYNHNKTFNSNHIGIWDPSTETKFCSIPFRLGSDSLVIDSLTDAWRKGEQAEYLQSDAFRVKHLNAPLDKRYV